MYNSLRHFYFSVMAMFGLCVILMRRQGVNQTWKLYAQVYYWVFEVFISFFLVILKKSIKKPFLWLRPTKYINQNSDVSDCWCLFFYFCAQSVNVNRSESRVQGLDIHEVKTCWNLWTTYLYHRDKHRRFCTFEIK